MSFGVSAESGRRRDDGIDIDPFVQQLAQQLVDDLPLLVDELVERIVTRDAFYAHVAESMRDEIHRATELHLGQLVRGLAGLEALSFELPRVLARTRAAEGVPLASLLNAYYMAAELLWDRLVIVGQQVVMRDLSAAEMLTGVSHMWRLITRYCDVLSKAYSEAVGDAIRRYEQERAQLLAALFDGPSSGRPAAGDAAHLLGLPDRGSFAVVAAERPERRGWIETIEQELRLVGITSVWRPEHDRITGLVVLGATGRARLTPGFLREQLSARGVVSAGISPLFAELRSTAHHVALADVAWRCAPPGVRAIVLYDDERLATVVLAAPDAATRATRAVLGPVLALPDDERDQLVTTLEAWVDGNGSTAGMALLLHCHRNTVRNRLARIESLIERSLQDPRSIGEVVLALTTCRLGFA